MNKEPFITLSNPFGASLNISREEIVRLANSELAKTAQVEKPEVSKEKAEPKSQDKAALIKLLTGPLPGIVKLQDEVRGVINEVEDELLKQELSKDIEVIGSSGKHLLEAAMKALGADAANAAQAAAPQVAPPPITGDTSAGTLSAAPTASPVEAPVAPVAPKQ